MASPIGYLIHPDPPPPGASPSTASPPHPALPAAGSRTPLHGATTTTAAAAAAATASPSLGPTSTPPVLTRPVPAPTSASAPGPLPLDSPITPASPGNHAQTQSLYQCADCLRRYSRPEHLQRHIAAHTLGKRFTCDICSKGFARADLLKRHRANHQDANGPKRRRFNSVPSASRVAQACTACAKARVKCEEIKPCTRCKNRGLTCEVASSEDAAMYLVHLSGNRQGHPQSTTPDSCYSASSAVGQQPQPQLAGALPSSSFMPSASPEDSKEGITTPAYPPYPDSAQVPTPETLSAAVGQNNLGYFRPYPAGDDADYTAQGQGRPNFPDFLRDVLFDQPLGNSARLPEAQGSAGLDFYDDANLDFKEFDFGLLDQWNFEAARNLADQSAHAEDPVGLTAMGSALVKIWTESPWRWTPGGTDNCFTEQSNLPLTPHAPHHAVDRVVPDTLHPSCRDKILAIVLGTCRESRMANRVASSFPSADTMDSWINVFLAAHLCQVSSWIHYASFSLNTQCPEWLAVASAAGAVLTPAPAFRRFGFALQEAIRVAIPERFEENNKNIGEIGNVQAVILMQDIGLWSGNRRKMEIAECHLTIPIAMMRYRGKFGRSAYPDIVIYPSDEGKVLEDKWKKWCQLESWKRLVFHAYLRDAQVSMTQLNNPSMSYAELTLPLPYPKELWFARTAEEFKIRYLQSGVANGHRLPCLGDLFRDINVLAANHHRLDVQLAISIYLHGFWSLVWEYRQLASIHAPSPTSPNHTSNMAMLLTTRHADLVTQLKAFRLLTHDHHHPNQQPKPPTAPLALSTQESLLLHLLFLNLHAALPDLHLFSGKEGEDRARRAYPALQRWAAGAESRVAVWHAAQVFRIGRLFPRGHLKDFWSVAVCHAGLCVWAWGVVVGAGRRGATEGSAGVGMGMQGQHHAPHQAQQHQHQMGGQHQHQGQQVVYLDGEETPAVQAWVGYGQGRPVIRGFDTTPTPASASTSGGGQGDGRGVAVEVSLENPRACMEVAQEILRANFVGVWESLPPLSENIIVVLKQLEKAAWAVGMG